MLWLAGPGAGPAKTDTRQGQIEIQLSAHAQASPQLRARRRSDAVPVGLQSCAMMFERDNGAHLGRALKRCSPRGFR